MTTGTRLYRVQALDGQEGVSTVSYLRNGVPIQAKIAYRAYGKVLYCPQCGMQTVKGLEPTWRGLVCEDCAARMSAEPLAGSEADGAIVDVRTVDNRHGEKSPGTQVKRFRSDKNV